MKFLPGKRGVQHSLPLSAIRYAAASLNAEAKTLALRPRPPIQVKEVISAFR